MFRIVNFHRTLAQQTLVWFLLVCALFLYLQLFVGLRTTVFLYGADQAVYLLNAMRMLEGQVIYRDFFHFLPPGTELIYLGLLELFGPRVWIPNALLLLLGVSLAWLSVVISRHIMSGASVFLPGLVFLTFAFRTALDATHHWFSALAAMAALALVLPRRSLPRLVGAGLLCGVASTFTTTRGAVALIALAVFVVWESRRSKLDSLDLLKREGVLVASYLAPFVTLNAYFAWKAGLRPFLDCTFTFVLKYYPADAQWNTWRVYMTEMPRLSPWYRLPGLGVHLFIAALLPLIFLLFISYYRREVRHAPAEPWEKLILICIFGLFLFVGIVPAPGWVRMCSVSLPALILFVWFLRLPGRLPRAISQLLWVSVVILAVGEVVDRQTGWKARLDVPAGSLAFRDPVIHGKYQWVLERTRPSEFFFEGEFPNIYFPLALRDPAKVPFITNTDYTRPEQVQDVVSSLEKHQVRFVLWSLGLDIPRPSPARDNLGPLRAYLRAHYHVVKTFLDQDQVWERNDSCRQPAGEQAH